MDFTPVTSRVPHLAALSKDVYYGVTETMLGSVGTALSILTLGRNFGFCRETFHHFENTRESLSLIYRDVLKIINPSAKFESDISNETGFISSKILCKIEMIGDDCIRSKNPVIHRIGSRGVYTLGALAAVATRIFDGTIGLIAAAASFAALGTNTTLNSLAFRGLKVWLVIPGDLAYCAITILNPSPTFRERLKGAM